tara:strand:- start:149 stop:343 length:195 start_codon:yes stop_codon:yes gene_type:complete
MEESDIKYLLKRNIWVAVYPSGNFWKVNFYKKSKGGKWITSSSTKKKTPEECYEWLELKFEKIK